MFDFSCESTILYSRRQNADANRNKKPGTGNQKLETLY